jgi:uncharacterized protein
MGADKNVELVRAGYAAFSTGDMATLNGLFAEDAVWHVPGSGMMSGPKQGRDAILAFFGETMARSNGTFTVSLLDLAGSDERVYALHHTHAERQGRAGSSTSTPSTSSTSAAALRPRSGSSPQTPASTTHSGPSHSYRSRRWAGP